jgi:rhodanese-related sulfurtransferase
MKFQNIDPIEVKKKIDSEESILILDVRTAGEYQQKHIENAKLIPLHELPNRYQELNPHQETVVVCEHGIRSLKACEFLAQSGFTDVYNMRGGMSRWTF